MATPAWEVDARSDRKAVRQSAAQCSARSSAGATAGTRNRPIRTRIEPAHSKKLIGEALAVIPADDRPARTLPPDHPLDRRTLRPVFERDKTFCREGGRVNPCGICRSDLCWCRAGQPPSARWWLRAYGRLACDAPFALVADLAATTRVTLFACLRLARGRRLDSTQRALPWGGTHYDDTTRVHGRRRRRPGGNATRPAGVRAVASERALSGSRRRNLGSELCQVPPATGKRRASRHRHAVERRAGLVRSRPLPGVERYSQ